MLSTTAELAGYSLSSRAFHRAFFAWRDALSLGPHLALASQGRWPSFMTDDYTSVEMSWSWCADGALPTVHYAMEPIEWDDAATAGQSRREAMACVDCAVPWASETDLRWCRYFFNALTLGAGDGRVVEAAVCNPPSQAFVGFDLEDKQIKLKCYFIPPVRATWHLGGRLPRLSDETATSLAVLSRACFGVGAALSKPLQGPGGYRTSGLMY